MMNIIGSVMNFIRFLTDLDFENILKNCKKEFCEL